MKSRALVAAAALLLPAVAAGQAPVPIALRPGLVITRSVRIAPRTYRLPAPRSLLPDSALITIRGDDITIDFQGATLEGLAAGAAPDQAAGIALRVDGGHNVRIRNATIRGYKVGILVRGTQGITLVDNDLSHNWKPRLYSLVEHESLVDWLSFHHNEHDEWLRFGAAIYLTDVKGGEVRNNAVVQGMNGLLLVRTDAVAIWDNNFSFNSGLGVGLYRSSDNTIVHNRIDYDVRGYSHGFYARGQDSAGLLIYEQSCRNVVVENSVTHGGDGLFLWAGQTTMDSGTGGANDNFFYGNDFSFAPANGIEATFSRNAFVVNHVEGNEYGVWGGYSFSSLIKGNDFQNNRTGVAIEHGQDNVIIGNRFAHDSTAIRLWAASIEPSEWGYPKHHDTRSRDHRITDNVFLGNRVALRARQTRGLVFSGNRWEDVDSVAVMRDTADIQMQSPLSPTGRGGQGVREPDPRGYPSSPLTRLPRSAIIVDEWGPYDWLSPKLWPVAGDSTRAIPLRLVVLGPRGAWRVVARRGIETLSQLSGQTGDTIAVTPAPHSAGDWELTLAQRGRRFSYGRFEPAINWDVRFFTWTDTVRRFENPLRVSAVPGAAPRGQPTRLDFMWYRPPQILAFLPADHWALQATGTVDLPPGTYTLRTVSDDAVRVWVDGTLVIDSWAAHESLVDTAPLRAGRHDLRVEYYQKDGWVELRLDIVRGREASTGSPGPH